MAITSSRAAIGLFYRGLEQDVGTGWVPGVSMLFNSSNQDSETYVLTGQAPALREWVGSRWAKPLRMDPIVIANKDFEATIEIPQRDFERDATGQIQMRINELVERSNGHWASLLSTLILNGSASVCYDGQYFFDTDHLEDDSGTQSNSIQVDIVTTTAPTADEMQSAILTATQQILGFKDNQGEPMNETATEFTVMVPIAFLKAAATALGATIISNTTGNIQALASLGGFNFRLAANARLSSWTNKFAVFRTDGSAAAMIRQEAAPVSISALAEGSEFAFNNKAFRFGISAARNVGYGYWQKACLVTFI